MAQLGGVDAEEFSGLLDSYVQARQRFQALEDAAFTVAQGRRGPPLGYVVKGEQDYGMEDLLADLPETVFACTGTVEVSSHELALLQRDLENWVFKPSEPPGQVHEGGAPARPRGDLDVSFGGLRGLDERELLMHPILGDFALRPVLSPLSEGPPHIRLFGSGDGDLLGRIRTQLSNTIVRHCPFTLRPRHYTNAVPGSALCVSVDTDADDVFGTLVLSVENHCECSGSGITVTYKDQSAHLPLSPCSGRGKLQWSAFLSTCTHTGHPVEIGEQTSLVYDIVLTKTAPIWGYGLTINQSAATVYSHYDREELVVWGEDLLFQCETVREECEAAGFYGEDSPCSKFGIVLTEVYGPMAIADAGLKGRDAAVFRALEGMGVSCEIVPIIGKEELPARGIPRSRVGWPGRLPPRAHHSVFTFSGLGTENKPEIEKEKTEKQEIVVFLDHSAIKKYMLPGPGNRVHVYLAAALVLNGEGVLGDPVREARRKERRLERCLSEVELYLQGRVSEKRRTMLQMKQFTPLRERLSTILTAGGKDGFARLLSFISSCQHPEYLHQLVYVLFCTIRPRGLTGLTPLLTRTQPEGREALFVVRRVVTRSLAASAENGCALLRLQKLMSIAFFEGVDLASFWVDAVVEQKIDCDSWAILLRTYSELVDDDRWPPVGQAFLPRILTKLERHIHSSAINFVTESLHEDHNVIEADSVFRIVMRILGFSYECITSRKQEWRMIVELCFEFVLKRDGVPPDGLTVKRLLDVVSEGLGLGILHAHTVAGLRPKLVRAAVAVLVKAMSDPVRAEKLVPPQRALLHALVSSQVCPIVSVVGELVEPGKVPPPCLAILGQELEKCRQRVPAGSPDLARLAGAMGLIGGRLGQDQGEGGLEA